MTTTNLRTSPFKRHLVDFESMSFQESTKLILIVISSALIAIASYFAQAKDFGSLTPSEVASIEPSSELASIRPNEDLKKSVSDEKHQTHSAEVKTSLHRFAKREIAHYRGLLSILTKRAEKIDNQRVEKSLARLSLSLHETQLALRRAHKDAMIGDTRLKFSNEDLRSSVMALQEAGSNSAAIVRTIDSLESKQPQTLSVSRTGQ